MSSPSAPLPTHPTAAAAPRTTGNRRLETRNRLGPPPLNRSKEAILADARQLLASVSAITGIEPASDLAPGPAPEAPVRRNYRAEMERRVQAALAAPRCTHVKANGYRCGSPALRAQRFCYFHYKAHNRPWDSGFPTLEDPNSVQIAVMQVLDALRIARIDVPTARTMLYGLRLAARVEQTMLIPQEHLVVLDAPLEPASDSRDAVAAPASPQPSNAAATVPEGRPKVAPHFSAGKENASPASHLSAEGRRAVPAVGTERPNGKHQHQGASSPIPRLENAAGPLGSSA